MSPFLLTGCKGKEFELTLAQEISFGTAAIRSLETRHPPGAENARRVQRIGKPLGTVTKRNVLYTFHVLDLPKSKALSLPGGPVAITNNLLVQLNDNQLAAVLSHEAGHIENNHFASLYHRRKDGLAVTGFLTGGLSLFKLATNEKLVTRWAFEPGWTADEEAAADRTAMDLLSAAGKPANLLIELLESPPSGMQIDATRLAAARAYASALTEHTTNDGADVPKASGGSAEATTATP